ncbi:MAG: hypothetical protein ACRD0H_26130, partial [Actinomycetes bacterium]
MGWNNLPVQWADLERALSGRAPPVHAQPAKTQSAKTQSAKTPPRTPYAELHCHSTFRFLDGAS